MYKTMLIFNSEQLLNKVENLNVWGSGSDFKINAIVNDRMSAYNELKNTKYDLVICETDIKGMNTWKLVESVKSEKLCEHIALCSELPDFESARKGIVFGVSDYFIMPFKENQFYSLFARIRNAGDNYVIENNYADKIAEMFKKRDSSIYSYITDMTNEIYRGAANVSEAENVLCRIYKNAADMIFSNNEWLDLYKSGRDKRYFQSSIEELFKDYCELFPAVNNEKIKEVMLYILNNPESDLKQKTIASEHYMNSSYLSTVFSAQTQIRFVDYLTTVKLKRAGWLLQNTSMKVAEIALRLDYKDIGYFSRMFKKQYGITPTEYRTPNDFIYEI